MMLNSGDSLQQVRTILSFVQPAFGASILISFYFWLRGRQVKDSSLLWLSATLLSSVVPGLLVPGLLGSYPIWVKAFWSGTANVLMAITAFKLLRVQDAIRLHRLDWGPKTIISVVAAASVTAWLLVSNSVAKSTAHLVGLNIDAGASLIALVAMCLCVAYSFYKYGYQPLMVLTIIDFVYIIWYQFRFALSGGEWVEHPILVVLNITSVSTMTMLFIALTLAWGLSHASRLRFRDSELVEVIVMFIDVRDSTKWAKKVADNAYVVKFMNKFTEWVLSRASQAPHGWPNVKHVGDGLMLVWEVPQGSQMLILANAIAGSGVALASGYESWVQSIADFYKEVPKGIGVGLAFGSAQRLTSENGSHDYSGVPVNLASKLQNLARPHSGVVILDDWPLGFELGEKFSKKGKMQIGDEKIPVRATDGVRLSAPHRNGSLN